MNLSNESGGTIKKIVVILGLFSFILITLILAIGITLFSFEGKKMFEGDILVLLIFSGVLYFITSFTNENMEEQLKETGQKKGHTEKFQVLLVKGFCFFIVLYAVGARVFKLGTSFYDKVSIIVFAIIFISVLVYRIISDFKVYSKWRKLIKVSAVIVNTKEVCLADNIYYLPVLKINFNNQEYEVTGDGNKIYQIGDIVNVWMDPNNPSENHFDNLASMCIRSILIRLIALISCLIISFYS